MDRVILGENCVYSADDPGGLNRNIIVCGGSGSGKTMSISEPCLLETCDSSLVVTATKRRILDKYIPLYQARGYDVLDLNFVHPAAGNVSYDPLKYVTRFADITYLAQCIVISDPRKHELNIADPFWDQAATSLVSSIIAYVKQIKPEPSFADVLAMIDDLTFDSQNSQDSLIRTSLDDKFDRLEKKQPNSFAVSCWKSFKRLPLRTAGCVFSTLNTTLDTVFSPEIRRMMRTKKSIDFKRMAEHKTLLCITTSPVNPSMNIFVNMFNAQMFKQLFECAEDMPGGRLPVPVHCVFDDFATGSRIHNFVEYISIFREKGLSVTLLLQSESQLEGMYGSAGATTIINNCDTYVYMGGMDLKTARSIAMRTDRLLIDVLSMPVGREIIMRRGSKPVETSRYDIRENELYQRITQQYEESVARKTELRDAAR